MEKVKETWMKDVKDPHIEGLKRPQGCRYHILHRSDNRRDVPMDDMPPYRLIDSPEAICDRTKANIMSNVTSFPNSIGLACGSRRKNSREAGSSGF